MKTTPINQVRVGEDGDLLRYGTQMGNLAADIDSRLNAAFATKAAADAAYGAYTAQGGVMREGMVRVIGGFFEIYRGGIWRGVQSVVRQTQTFFETTYGGGDEAGVCNLTIPDLGHPVYADVSGAVTVSASAGSQVRGVIRLDAVEATPASRIANRSGQLPAGELVDMEFTPYRIGPISGTHTLIVGIRRVLGTGNWFVPAGGNQLRVDLIAA